MFDDTKNLDTVTVYDPLFLFCAFLFRIGILKRCSRPGSVKFDLFLKRTLFRTSLCGRFPLIVPTVKSTFVQTVLRHPAWSRAEYCTVFLLCNSDNKIK
jgi:hypothetical protein